MVERLVVRMADCLAEQKVERLVALLVEKMADNLVE